MGKPGFIIPYRGFFVNRFHVFIYKIFLIIETLNYKHYSSAQASLPTDAGNARDAILAKVRQHITLCAVALPVCVVRLPVLYCTPFSVIVKGGCIGEVAVNCGNHQVITHFESLKQG